ncbi:MAG: hypothetical protein ACLQIB_14290 [Isosphaeraceae bacterium]
MDSTGNMRSGGVMFDSSLRCAIDGPWQDEQPTALEECGGDQALAEAIRRIQDLGYFACLHDNYQDMYCDAKQRAGTRASSRNGLMDR